MAIRQHILDFSTFIGGLAAIWFFWDLCDKSTYCFLIATLLISSALVGWLLYRWQPWRRPKPTSPEVPGGTLPLNSPFYIERPPVEKTCYALIVKDDALLRIKAPRQMGKSSLLIRVLHHAEQQGARSACLTFQEVDKTIVANLDQLLQWFCTHITHQLQLPDKVAELWQGVRGSKTKCTNYFETYLLKQLPDPQPLILGLDEVDAVFAHPEVAAEFAGLLRSWFEKGRRNQGPWRRVGLVITHSQEVYIPLNMDQSPFNVGTAIELQPFTPDQVAELVQRYGLAWQAEAVTKLMALVGGHPYLVQVALSQIAQGQVTLEKLIEIAPYENGPYADHLRRHRVNLEKHAELATEAKKVMTANYPVPVREIKKVFQLHSMGLVKMVAKDEVMPLCELYRRYFGERL